MEYDGEEKRLDFIKYNAVIVEINNKLNNLIHLYERDSQLREKDHEDHEIRIRTIEKVSDNTRAISDHESRIRDVENEKWRMRGINSVIATGISIFVTVLLKLIFRN